MQIKNLVQASAFFLSLWVAACATPNKQPAHEPGLTVSYEEFQKILSPRSVVPLEGQNAFLTVFALPGDKYPMLYRYDLATKKFTKEYDHGQTISGLFQDRVGNTTYALIDGKGDENFGIYTYDPVKKSVTPFFVKPGFKTLPADTDAKGESFFFASNFENKAVFSIYRMDLATKKVERLSDGKTSLSPSAVSPSGLKIVAERSQSNNENQLFLIDVKTKKTTLIFKQKASVFNEAFFTSDENTIVGTSDFKEDRMGCAQIDLKRPNQVQFILRDTSKDISCRYNEWAKLYEVTEAARGRKTLKLFKKMFSDEVPVPQLFNNQSVGIVFVDRKANQLMLDYSAANNPGFYYNLDLATGKVAPVLDLNVSRIKAEQLASSYDFDFKSFDGLPIHGVIFAKSDWLTSGQKYPLIVWPHGGPDFNETHDYRGIFQFLVLNGFVVYAPNVRGSTGYGKKFETLNDKDWGGAHIKDFLQGKDEVAKLPYVDSKNVFLLGGSFGGYSTLAAITLYPPTFKAAVGVVAIGNLFTFMKSIPPDEGWQTEFKREMGEPVKDNKLYQARSPFFHINNLKTPLQIYQAENDVRTVKAEMDSFVAELRKQNKPVDYTVLRDVGHGLETPESRKLVYEGAVQFFKKSMTK